MACKEVRPLCKKKKKKVSVMYRKNMEAVMVKKSRNIEKFLERDISLP